MLETKKSSTSFIQRTYFVEPKVQLKILSYALVVHTLTFLVIYVFFSKIVFDQYFLFAVDLNGHKYNCNPDEIAFMLDPTKVAAFHWFYVITYFLTLTVLFVLLTVVTHRLVGPIYRLKKALREENDRDLQDMTFRENDYFKDLAILIQQTFKRKSAK